MKHLSAIDASKAGYLVVPRFANVAAFPSAASGAASLAYDNEWNELYQSDGSAWRCLTKSRTYTVTTGSPTISVPGSRLVSALVIIGSGAGNVTVGTTDGGDEVLLSEPYGTSGHGVTLGWYTPSSATWYFSEFTGTLTVQMLFA